MSESITIHATEGIRHMAAPLATPGCDGTALTDG